MLPSLRHWLLSFMVLTFSAEATAQAPVDPARPAMRSQSTGSGLPNATVHDVLLDQQGRLWAATMEGPATFTGGTWVPFPLPGGNLSAFIRTLEETPDGSLWFGTEANGLWQYRQNTFTHFGQKNGFRPKRVNHLLTVQGKEGGSELWAATNEGVARFSGGTWHLMGKESGLSDLTVWKLREVTDRDGQRRVWAATAKGLCRWTGQLWQPIDRKEGFPGTHASDILEVDEGGGRHSIWVGSWGLGLVRWDGTRWTVHGPKEGFSSTNPTTLATTRRPDGRAIVWAGTYESGLLWFDGRQWKHLTPERGFPSVGIYRVMANPNGKPTLWIGSRGAGVVSLDMGGWWSLDRDQSLPNPEVTCFAEEAADSRGQGRFWIGTRRGLQGWQAGHAQVASGMPSEYLVSLLPSRSPEGRRRLWATTLTGLAVQEEGTAWRVLGPKDGLPEGLANDLEEIREPDGTRTLWVGLDRGVAHLKHGKWHVSAASEGFPASAVVALQVTEDPDGSPSLWMGTRDQGVRRLKQGKLQAFGPDSGIPPFTITDFHESRTPDGRRWLWVSTLGGGIARLEKDRPQARWVSCDSPNLPGLSMGVVNRLAEDGQGRLYLATPSGVIRITLDVTGPAPEPRQLETFTLGDGLPSLNCLTVRSDRYGRIWVGTSQGAAVLDPGLEQSLPPPPMPLVEKVVLLKKGIRVEAGQRLGYKDNHLVFTFSLPVFHRREDTVYRSQLVGLEAAPEPWQSSMIREFAALAPGRYTLQLWARDHRGLVSGPASFSFTVARPPWATLWAYGIYLLLIGGAFFGFLRGRTQRLEARNQRLEAQVSARTMELQVANHELKAALQEVKALQGLIPICSYCKKVRDEAGLWDQIESYISAHSEADFSHGICPECVQKHFPKIYQKPERP